MWARVDFFFVFRTQLVLVIFKKIGPVHRVLIMPDSWHGDTLLSIE